MASDWLLPIFEWLNREKEWLFSGLGISALAAVCFLFRWLISLSFNDYNVRHAEELVEFRRQVNNRFDVLVAWIQLLHREKAPSEGTYSQGFHETAATFELPPASQIPKIKEFINKNDLKFFTEQNWKEEYLAMDAAEAHLIRVKKQHKKASKAKAVLLWAGCSLALVSILLLASAIL